MEPGGMDDAFRQFLGSWNGEQARIDTAQVIAGTTAYLVPSFDGAALQFSFPVIIPRDLAAECSLDPAGSDGAVSSIIEHMKERAEQVPGLGPLFGRGVAASSRYRDTIEPYTIIRSDAAIGAGLWKADARNFWDKNGIHLLLRGAVPAPPPGGSDGYRKSIALLADLADTVETMVSNYPARHLEPAWLSSLDQKGIRKTLRDRGLVSFVGDGSKLARTITHLRPFYRVAGPKTGVSVPFACPQELEPVEIELPASGGTITGLGIHRREVVAIAGSNAQGKTTFLEGILAGMDDHAPHDGREHVITEPGACIAESTTMGLGGADISMFFHALPPGVSGTVKSVHGMGSGSMTMAHQVQAAVSRNAPLLIIDEDRSAPNLLVRSCLQKEEITPLSDILAHHRERMGDTALVFAACAMDTLIAQADRILVLDRHQASAIDTKTFRHRVAELLRKTADGLQ